MTKRKIHLVREHWPAIPGHGEEYKTWLCEVKAETETHLLIRKYDKLRFLRRWEWRPRKNMFVDISQEVFL